MVKVVSGIIDEKIIQGYDTYVGEQLVLNFVLVCVIQIFHWLNENFVMLVAKSHLITKIIRIQLVLAQNEQPKTFYWHLEFNTNQADTGTYHLQEIAICSHYKIYVTKLTASHINESITSLNSVKNTLNYCVTKFSFKQCRW